MTEEAGARAASGAIAEVMVVAGGSGDIPTLVMPPAMVVALPFTLPGLVHHRPSVVLDDGTNPSAVLVPAVDESMTCVWGGG